MRVHLHRAHQTLATRLELEAERPAEVRFAPVLQQTADFSMSGVLDAALRGLERGRLDFGVSSGESFRGRYANVERTGFWKTSMTKLSGYRPARLNLSNAAKNRICSAPSFARARSASAGNE